MPLYDYKCSKCGTVEERIAKFDEHILVCSCGGAMNRQIHGNFGINMGAAGAYGYFDEHLGTYVRTNTHRRQLMKEKGVYEKYGKGWY